MIYIIPTDTCFWLACPINEPKSYEKIYNIKKRNSFKPLSIMVPDFSWLEKNTSLTKEQVNFLKNYEKPFSILTDCNYLKLWLNYVNEEKNEEFFNRDIYDKFAFRVAHNTHQEELIKEVWPIFLTSANHSKNKEIYNYDELEIYFWNLMESWKIKFIWEKTDLEKNPPSEIFEFVWESLEKNFLRK